MIKAHLETLASLFWEKDLARKRKRETKENNISDANVVPCRKINPAYIRSLDNGGTTPGIPT
jgi:hypothetical protein